MGDFTADISTGGGYAVPHSMLADLIKGPFSGKKFKFHQSDPATGKRKAREIGG